MPRATPPAVASPSAGDPDAAFAAGARDPAVVEAAASGLEERRARAQVEVDVEAPERGPVGVWRARSRQSTGIGGRVWDVTVAATTPAVAWCGCPDFATNRLGTCKHVEAVWLAIGDGASVALRTPVVRVRPLEQGGAASELQLLAPAGDEPRVSMVAEALEAMEVDPGGAARRLEAAADRGLVWVTPDAAAWVGRVGARRAQRASAAAIRSRIRALGPRLPGVDATLKPYQLEGVAFLAATGRAVLADEMGLGKTLQAIAAAEWLFRDPVGGAQRALVVAPASLKSQWAREIARFTSRDVVVAEGPRAARLAAYRRRATWTVVNYELVLRDLGSIQGELGPDLLVLDEAQRIRNWRTKTADAVKRLETDRCFVLTGTPLENRLDDLYSLVQVVDQHRLAPLWHFLARYRVTSRSGRAVGYRHLAELRRRLQPVWLRRDRRVVSDELPPRTVVRRDVPLSPVGRRLHDAAVRRAAQIAARARAGQRRPGDPLALMKALQQARLACACPAFVDPEAPAHSPKLEELARLLEELAVDGGRKVVVFTEWARMSERVVAVAEALGLGVVRLHGGVPTAKRGALVARFNDSPGVQVFVSTDAGATGLDLQAASAMVVLDLPWNPAVLDQRLARIHRLGQSEATIAVLLVAEDSYEARIATVLADKRALASAVVEPDSDVDQLGATAPDDGPAPSLAVDALEAPIDPHAVPGASHRTGGPGDSLHGVPVDAWVEAAESALGRPVEQVLHATATEGDRARVFIVVDGGQREVEALRATPGLPGGVDVRVLDRATLDALRQGGLGGALSRATAAWRRADVGGSRPSAPPPPAPECAPPKAPPAVGFAPGEIAREALAAGAEALAAGDCPVALRELATAMLAAAARDASLADEPLPALTDASRWLYGTLVPRGAVSARDAGFILRACSLAESEQPIPEALAIAVLADAERLVGIA